MVMQSMCCGRTSGGRPVATSALKSGLVPVPGLSGLRLKIGPVLIFPNMEGPWTGPHKTSFTQPCAVLGPVLVKTGS